MLKIPEQPAALKALLTASADTQADVTRFDEAIERNAQKIATAKADLDRDTVAQTAIDTELALATDEAVAKTIEARAKKAGTAVDTARAALDRVERVHLALKVERDKAITLLAGQVLQLEAAIGGQYRQDAQAAVISAMHEAAQPLLATLQQIAMIDQASGRGWFQQMLYEVLIPSGKYQRPIVSDGRFRDDDGGGISMTATAHTDDALVQLQQTFGAPIRALREAQQALNLAKNPVASDERARREREAKARAAEAELTAAEDAAQLQRQTTPPPKTPAQRAVEMREARRIREGGQPGDNEFHVQGERIWAPSIEAARERYAANQQARAAEADGATATA